MHSNATNSPAAGWRPALLIIVPAGLAALYGWAVFLTTFHHPGLIGLDYIAPGSDWMVLYHAARLALGGHLALTRDNAAFTASLNASLSAWLPQPLFYRPWVYPPSFLLILLPFGLAGFASSYAAFQLASAALLAAALAFRAQDRRNSAWLVAGALACPAASINVVDGQCAFLVAGLLVLGSRLLPQRPVLGGLVLGILAVKPQFGLLVPVMLAACRSWRGAAGAAACVLAMAAASVAVLGVQPWLWWLAQAASSYGQAGSAWSRFGRMWGGSVFTCVALLGAPSWLASAVQFGAMALAAGCVYAAFRARLDRDVQLAVLLAAAILAAPHFGSYDLLLLTVAGGLWFASLTAASTKDAILLLVLWLAPLASPPLLMPAGRAEPVLVVGFLWVLLRRPVRQAGPPLAARPAC